MSLSSQPRFARLIDLAQARSSEDRRELLREVTDAFFTHNPQRTARENALFEDVLRTVAAELNDAALVEFAEHIAGRPDGPSGVINDLARRDITVAGPILQRSSALQDTDLIDIVATQREEHRRAIACRETVSGAVSDALVSQGDDETVNTLLANTGATIARPTMERVVDRAHASPVLHQNLVRRPDLPIDLMNEMMFSVEERLRAVILQRNAHAEPAEVEAALSKARERLARRTRIDAEEDKAARARLDALRQREGLTAAGLIGLYRAKDFAAFVLGLAEMTGLDPATTRSVLERKDMDALAMICRAAGLERPLFVTIAILSCGGDQAVGQAEMFGKLYADVPIEAAQRAMRFFKVRKSTGDQAAA